MQTCQDATQHKELMSDHGQMYYPVPLPESSKGESEGGTGVLRIKLVISKQELEVMLKKGGVSVSDLASHMKKESLNNAVVIEDEDNRRCGRWKPVLDSASCFPAKLISLPLKPLDQQHTLAKGRLQVDK
nr:hypothetical protein [Tanacetum cinerariifolium]